MCFECLKPAAPPPQVPVPSGFVERPKRISRRATYGVHTGVSYDTPDTLSKADGVTALRLQLTRLSDSMARRFAREDQNVLFYRGDSQCAPDSLFIDVLHHKWEGDFEMLEEKHGWVQWLFPTFSTSNSPMGSRYSYPLTKAGAAKIRADPDAQWRFLRSYKMMLSFMGMRLADQHTGRIVRAADYEERLANLRRNPHNLQRVSRVLVALGQLGGRRPSP